MSEKTDLMDVKEKKKKKITQTINEVFDALKERGYEPMNQIVGYIISGDPGYISNYKKSRNKLIKFDRSEIVAVLVQEILKKWGA